MQLKFLYYFSLNNQSKEPTSKTCVIHRFRTDCEGFYDRQCPILHFLMKKTKKKQKKTKTKIECTVCTSRYSNHLRCIKQGIKNGPQASEDNIRLLFLNTSILSSSILLKELFRGAFPKIIISQLRSQ